MPRGRDAFTSCCVTLAVVATGAVAASPAAATEFGLSDQHQLNFLDAAAIDAVAGAPLAGETVTLDGTDSDVDGIVLSRVWDLDDDGSFDDGQGPGVATAFSAPGARTVRYRVTDDAGETSTASRVVNVGANQKPTLSISVTPQSPQAGSQADLAAVAADPEGRGLEAVSWDLDGDGRYGDATGPAAKWTFPAAGAVTIRGRVADAGGAVTTTERLVTVRPAPQQEIPAPGGQEPPASGGGTAPPVPGPGGGTVKPAAPIGGFTTPKTVRRAALLRSGLKIVFSKVRKGARLDSALVLVPKRGRAVTLGRVRKSASRAGTLTVQIKLSKAGRRALRRPVAGKLSLSVLAKVGAEPAMTYKRALRYRP